MRPSVIDETGLELPSIEKAEQYRNVTCPRKLEDGKLVPHPIRSFKDFAQFGIGVLLYFQLLRKLKLMLLIMCVLALPQVILSILSSKVEDTPFHAEKTTLAAFGHANITAVELPLVDIELNKSDVAVVIVGFDTIMSILFLVFLQSLRRTQKKEALLADRDTISAADYTVRVKNLPANPKIEDLVEFFSQRWGPVADSSISYNDFEVVDLFVQRGRLKHEVMANKKRGNTYAASKILDKIKKLDKRIEIVRSSLKRRAVDAYITFEDMESAKKCNKAYPNTWWSVCCMKKRNKFKGKRIRVNPAQEPSNILFHNNKYSERSRQLRRCVTLVVTILLMAISMSIVYVASAQRQELESNKVECLTDIIFTRDDALADPTLIPCYCQSLGRKIVDDLTTCKDWVKDFALSKAMTAIVALTIVIVNGLLKTSVVTLVRWEKHATRSSEERAITKKLFIGLFTNTGIILMLVNANFDWLGNHGALMLFRGSFADFNSEWYRAVGVSLLLTMVLNCFNPHILPLLMIPIKACNRRCKANKMATQKELNDLYSGDEFIMSDRYAAIMNTVFVSLLYSGGMPVLLFTAALTIGLMRLFDKIALLRLYRYPPRLDESLALFTSRTMKWAIILHAAFAAWMYSAPEILQSHDGLESDQIPVHEFGWSFDLSRVTKLNGLPLFSIFVFLALSELAKRFSWIFFPCRMIIRCLCCCCRKCRGKADARVEPGISVNVKYYDAIRSGIRIESYHISRQPEYQDAFIRTESGLMLPNEKLTKELETALNEIPGEKKLKPQASPLSGTQGGRMQPDQINVPMNPQGRITPTMIQGQQNLQVHLVSLHCPTCSLISNVPAATPAGTMFTCPFCRSRFMT